MYERPSMQPVTELAEGVFMSSGAQADEETSRCPIKRKEANPGADQCQICAATNAQCFDKDQVEKWYASKGQTYQGLYKADYYKNGGCPKGMPEKES